MKKFLLYLLPFCLLAASCKKFLEESSQDEIRPSSIEDLSALMNSDAYPYNSHLEAFSDMLTDDIKSYGMPSNVDGTPNTIYSSYYNNGQGIFSFNVQELEGSLGTAAATLNAWKTLYDRIKGCNVIIDYVDKVTGEQDRKNAIVGQVLFLRAFYYFKLVQLYCVPYNSIGVNPETALGVPLILSMEVSDKQIGRSSLRQTFDQIEKDLLTSADLLKESYTPSTAFRVGHIAAYSLLSRFYLYRGLETDMDKVIHYAGLVLEERPMLTPLKNSITSTGFTMTGIYDQATSNEVIWQYGSGKINIFFPAPLTYAGLHAPFAVSDKLRTMYERGPDNDHRGDLRYAAYFFKYTVGGTEYLSRSAKSGANANPADRGIRTAEIYLNHAEALARRFKKEGKDADRVQALSDLNILRESRYDTRNTTYANVTASNASELIQLCLDERRRELCLEETFRWADIKRLGLSVTHNFIDADGNNTVFTLPANSLLYALPIPVTALERNNNLTPNPR